MNKLAERQKELLLWYYFYGYNDAWNGWRANISKFKVNRRFFYSGCFFNSGHLGFSDYISKPIDLKLLENIIKKFSN